MAKPKHIELNDGDIVQVSTGYDPTLGAAAPAAGNKRSDYMRAQAACLEGRGYSVQ